MIKSIRKILPKNFKEAISDLKVSFFTLIIAIHNVERV
jgi:hypothetical protein